MVWTGESERHQLAAKRIKTNLKYQVDKRYSSFVQEYHEEKLNVLLNILKGKGQLIPIQWNGDYGCSIDLKTGKMVYFKKDFDMVIAGNFMKQWEVAHKKYFGVTESEWNNKLSLEEKAIIESKLQIKLWVELEYKDLWIETYFPKVYDKIWWEEREKLPRDAQCNIGHPLFRKMINKYYKEMGGKE